MNGGSSDYHQNMSYQGFAQTDRQTNSQIIYFGVEKNGNEIIIIVGKMSTAIIFFDTNKATATTIISRYREEGGQPRTEFCKVEVPILGLRCFQEIWCFRYSPTIKSA